MHMCMYVHERTVTCTSTVYNVYMYNMHMNVSSLISCWNVEKNASSDSCIYGRIAGIVDQTNCPVY